VQVEPEVERFSQAGSPPRAGAEAAAEEEVEVAAVAAAAEEKSVEEWSPRTEEEEEHLVTLEHLAQTQALVEQAVSFAEAASVAAEQRAAGERAELAAEAAASHRLVDGLAEEAEDHARLARSVDCLAPCSRRVCRAADTRVTVVSLGRSRTRRALPRRPSRCVTRCCCAASVRQRTLRANGNAHALRG
jgi:hypothetical protein